MGSRTVKPHKSKHNKSICRRCAYHIIVGGNRQNLMCNYSCVTGTTCLHKTENGVEDRRGEDYNNCKLFLEGDLLDED